MDRSSEQQTMELLHDLSQITQTGLSREQLRICMDLLRAGESPHAIADSIKALRKEASK